MTRSFFIYDAENGKYYCRGMSTGVFWDKDINKALRFRCKKDAFLAISVHQRLMLEEGARPHFLILQKVFK